ncbi:MAG: hypothetical protein M1598_03590 [Actinobacteria bacterium]|nr:hypothetical protein [Actinomycetota bacterium]
MNEANNARSDALRGLSDAVQVSSGARRASGSKKSGLWLRFGAALVALVMVLSVASPALARGRGGFGSRGGFSSGGRSSLSSGGFRSFSRPPSVPKSPGGSGFFGSSGGKSSRSSFGGLGSLFGGGKSSGSQVGGYSSGGLRSFSTPRDARGSNFSTTDKSYSTDQKSYSTGQGSFSSGTGSYTGTGNRKVATRDATAPAPRSVFSPRPVYRDYDRSGSLYGGYPPVVIVGSPPFPPVFYNDWYWGMPWYGRWFFSPTYFSGWGYNYFLPSLTGVMTAMVLLVIGLFFLMTLWRWRI